MPWEPLPDGNAEPRPVREGLDAVMQRLAGTSVSAIETVMDSWHDIVGRPLASTSSPARIDDGCLTVRTADAATSSEIRWLEPTIIERVSALAEGPPLTRVKVVVRAPREPRPDTP